MPMHSEREGWGFAGTPNRDGESDTCKMRGGADMVLPLILFRRSFPSRVHDCRDSRYGQGSRRVLTIGEPVPRMLELVDDWT